MDKGKIRMAISGACGLALAGAMVIASPLYATPAASAFTVAAAQQDAPQAQSVSGMIASVGRNSFTLNVGPSAAAHGQQMQQTSPKSMIFLINQNTTVDGKLKVGANADVTYREDNGNNVAISVRVTQ